MSWLRSALNRAAEAAGAGGKSIAPNLGRVRTYAGNVVQNAGNAVAGGAKIVLERAAGKHYNNFKHAVRRLDEVSLHARGEERTLALARWLGALKDLDKDSKSRAEKSGAGDDTSSPSPKPRIEGSEEDNYSKVAQVLFYDPDVSSEPLTFRDVFLRSNALENISISLILEMPEEEDIAMVTEMFGLCLAGGPELHHAIISGLQDLSKAIASYHGVLMHRDDLLRMAADTITGLKCSAEVERLEAEAWRLQQQISEKSSRAALSDMPPTNGVEPVSIEGGQPEILTDLPSALREGSAVGAELLELGTRLVEVEQQKQDLLQQGDTEEIRNLKVEKMKLIGVELVSGSQLHKDKVTDARQQKLDAMAYRVTKAQEVLEAEKIISAEMQVLQKRRDELETELNQIKQQMDIATKKHIHIQEEKEQFDEASSNMVATLSIQEEDSSRLLTFHKADAEVANTWGSFLGDTWLLQKSTMESKEKQAKMSLDSSQEQLLKLATLSLAYRQVEVQAVLARVNKYAEELEVIRLKRLALEEQGMDGAVADIANGRKRIEEKFLESETQLRELLVAVARAQGSLEPQLDTLKDSQTQKQLLASLNDLRSQALSMKRPVLDIERPPVKTKRSSKSSESWGRSRLSAVEPANRSLSQSDAAPVSTPTLPREKSNQDSSESVSSPVQKSVSKEEVEAAAEVEGWEFDELEEAANSVAPATDAPAAREAGPELDQPEETAATPVTEAKAPSKSSKGKKGKK